jgi:hypothetical protein
VSGSRSAVGPLRALNWSRPLDQPPGERGISNDGNTDTAEYFMIKLYREIE